MNIPSPSARSEKLIARRNQKMARTPHAYVRGNTAHYYEWLDSQHASSLPHGPAIWICGDCHLGNLGPLADAHGDVAVQIRDFDQTLIGNPAHDLIRLALSLATAARGSRLPGIVTAHMLEHMMEGYAAALNPAKKHSAGQKPDEIKAVMRGADEQTWKGFAKNEIANAKPKISLGKNFWPLSKAEKKGISDLLESQNVLHLVTTLKSRDDDADVKLLDAAYWVKGCSSLGRLRYAVLLCVAKNDFCLLDIKEAVQAKAPRYPHVKMPRDNAQRVVEGARHMSPALGERMIAERFLGHGVFIRELLPQDLKLEIDQLKTKEAIRMARYLAYVIGCAHGRQMDPTTRRDWSHELKLDHTKTLAAPAWLWSSVVQLMADHEVGYLEHCRKYALGVA